MLFDITQHYSLAGKNQLIVDGTSRRLRKKSDLSGYIPQASKAPKKIWTLLQNK